MLEEYHLVSRDRPWREIRKKQWIIFLDLNSGSECLLINIKFNQYRFLINKVSGLLLYFYLNQTWEDQFKKKILKLKTLRLTFPKSIRSLTSNFSSRDHSFQNSRNRKNSTSESMQERLRFLTQSFPKTFQV